MKLPSIQEVLLEAKRTAFRFPLALLCAFAATGAALTAIEKEATSGMRFPILFAAALGVPLMTALVLSAEKWKWSQVLSAGSQSIGMLLLIVYGFTVPPTVWHGPGEHLIRFGLLAIGLVLLVMILPFLKKGDQNGFWQYNKALAFRLIVAGIFSTVLFAGLAMALVALNTLFGAHISDKRYPELWVLVAGLFAPWFFLSGVPEDLDGLDRTVEYPRGLKIFAQYILFSLVIVYLVILYAYLLKILLQWSWPKGGVSFLILGFSATAILTILLMHPVRNRPENTWIRAAGKWLYIVLIPLIVVLFLAVTERIGDYGITESRYAGIALGLWLAAQTLYYLFSRSKSVKFTIGSLCLLLFLVNCGPWGMLSTARRSQVGRLQRLLVRYQILIQGKVQKEHGTVSHKDATEITSIVRYLEQIHGYGSIRSWFADSLQPDSKSSPVDLHADEVLSRMGMPNPYLFGSNPSTRYFGVDPGKSADISGYDRMLQDQQLSQFQNSVLRPGQPTVDVKSYSASDDLTSMSLMVSDGRGGLNALQFDIGAFAKALLHKHDAGNGNMTPEELSLEVEQNGQKARLFIRRLSLICSADKINIQHLTFDIAYTIRK